MAPRPSDRLIALLFPHRSAARRAPPGFFQGMTGCFSIDWFIGTVRSDMKQPPLVMCRSLVDLDAVIFLHTNASCGDQSRVEGTLGIKEAPDLVAVSMSAVRVPDALGSVRPLDHAASALCMWGTHHFDVRSINVYTYADCTINIRGTTGAQLPEANHHLLLVRVQQNRKEGRGPPVYTAA